MTSTMQKSASDFGNLRYWEERGRAGSVSPAAWKDEMGEVRRRPTKENTEQTTAPRTQSREGASSGLLSVREVARKEKRTQFTALLDHVTVHLLRDSYYALKRSAAGRRTVASDFQKPECVRTKCLKLKAKDVQFRDLWSRYPSGSDPQQVNPAPSPAT